jgi:Tfp pilus assembly protein PilF
VLLRYGRPEESMKALREAIKILPEHPRAHASLGATLCSTGKLADATEELKKALKLQPDLHEARYWMGVVHVRNNDRNAAFEEYKRLQDGDKALAEKLFKEIYG